MLTDKNIEELRKRIGILNLSFVLNPEQKARERLINPTLNCLGWDVSDKRRVDTEYSIPGPQNSFPDYALLTKEGNPAVFAEAKKLGNLGEDAVEQLKQYGLQEITNNRNEQLAFLVLTNGNDWEFYPPPPTKGSVQYGDWFYTLNIETDDTSEIRDDLNNLLARQNVLSGDSSKYLEKLFSLYHIRKKLNEI